MDLIIKKFAELINVKTIVTFAVIYVFIRLVMNGQADVQASMQIVTMVIAFYFGTQYDKTSTKNNVQVRAKDAQATGQTAQAQKQNDTDMGIEPGENQQTNM